MAMERLLRQHLEAIGDRDAAKRAAVRAGAYTALVGARHPSLRLPAAIVAATLTDMAHPPGQAADLWARAFQRALGNRLSNPQRRTRKGASP